MRDGKDRQSNTDIAPMISLQISIFTLKEIWGCTGIDSLDCIIFRKVLMISNLLWFGGCMVFFVNLKNVWIVEFSETSANVDAP